jgi:uncharacterized repeat protein (TIGR03899 family)
MSETNISVVDTKSLSEPISKLIEAVQSAIGVLYEPTQIRRIAKADADASLIKMKADLAMRDLVVRAEGRVKAKELRRQQNVESIVAQAVKFLPETVSNEKVDEDWTVQFFESCQDVGNEEMQSLWAKVLAGEVAQPGSYSLRTLHIVKLLRKEDAELFTKLCSFIWSSLKNTKFHACVHTEDIRALLKDKGINYSSLLHLESLGFINVGQSGFPFKERTSHSLSYFGIKHIFIKTEDCELDGISAYSLTVAGSELAPICGAKPDEEYRVKLIESLAQEGISTDVVED